MSLADSFCHSTLWFKSDLKSISRCSHCRSLYTTQKIAAITLPCGHTFCRQCIEQATRNDIATCYKCKRVHHNYVGHTQRNFVLTRLLEKLKLLNEPRNRHSFRKWNEDFIVFKKDDKRLLELAECSICIEMFDEKLHAPITISCGHTFCARCVKSFHNQFECSICRATLSREIRSCAKDKTLIKLINKLHRSDKCEMSMDDQPVGDTSGTEN